MIILRHWFFSLTYRTYHSYLHLTSWIKLIGFRHDRTIVEEIALIIRGVDYLLYNTFLNKKINENDNWTLEVSVRVALAVIVISWFILPWLRQFVDVWDIIFALLCSCKCLSNVHNETVLSAVRLLYIRFEPQMFLWDLVLLRHILVSNPTVLFSLLKMLQW